MYTANTESALATPSFSYDEGTKVVTITDTANGAIEDKVYQLGFFESATAADPVATVIAVNGEVVGPFQDCSRNLHRKNKSI